MYQDWKRDGGPSKEDIHKEESDAPQAGCRFCSCNWNTDEDDISGEESIVTRMAHGGSWKAEDICNISTLTALSQDQQSGNGAVAMIYKIVKQDSELLRETLERGSLELKQLYKMRGSMRVNSEGILEVRYMENQREKWRVFCLEASRNIVIWTTHRQAHSGVSRTTNRIKMTWY